MQHSVRSVPLAADPAGGERGLPRQDRPAPPRRNHRTAAGQGEVGEVGTAGHRSRREIADSFFSIEQPPPLEAPPGITEITGWELASAMWRHHLPEQLLGVDCAACKQSWPCDAWELADDIISQCCEAAQQVPAKS